jgi:hypothetical protein
MSEEFDKEALALRSPDGKFLKGNQLGRAAKGIKHGTRHAERVIKRERKALEREINQRAQDMATNLLNEKLGDVLDAVFERAMAGDTKAMALWMRHSTPVAPQAPKLVDSELLRQMQHEPPEQIIQSVVKAMAAGEVDVMLGKEIISACKASIESNFTDRLRRLMKKAQEQNIGIEELIPDLIAITEHIEPITLEHKDDA